MVGVNKRDKEEKDKLLQGMMEEAYSINANAIPNSLAVLYNRVRGVTAYFICSWSYILVYPIFANVTCFAIFQAYLCMIE